MFFSPSIPLYYKKLTWLIESYKSAKKKQFLISSQEIREFFKIVSQILKRTRSNVYVPISKRHVPVSDRFPLL